MHIFRGAANIVKLINVLHDIVTCLANFEKLFLFIREKRLSMRSVRSWGAGTSGQLGDGQASDVFSPKEVGEYFLSCKNISCGGSHGVGFNGDGTVIYWGGISFSSTAEDSEIESPSLAPQVINLNVKVVQVSAGWGHSALVTSCGRLFTFGEGTFGQLGHGEFRDVKSPKLVENILDYFVKETVCGLRHTLARTESNEEKKCFLFSWGASNKGQTGVSTEVTVRKFSEPKKIETLESKDIVKLISGGDHSGAISGDGMLFLWGKGFPGLKDINTPSILEMNLFPSQVVFGWNHGLILTEEGSVWSFGSNRYGQLGIGKLNLNENLDEGERKNFEAIATVNGTSIPLYKIWKLNNIKIVKISAGSEHSVAVSDKGKVYSWGWGEHGQLGLGDTKDQVYPSEVENLEVGQSQKCVFLTSGSGFTFVGFQ